MLTAVRISNLKAGLSSFFIYRDTDDFIYPAIQLGGDGGDTVNCTATTFEVLSFKNLYVMFGKN